MLNHFFNKRKSSAPKTEKADSLDQIAAGGLHQLSREESAAIKGGAGLSFCRNSNVPACQTYSLVRPQKNRGNYGPIIVIEDTHFKPGKD